MPYSCAKGPALRVVGVEILLPRSNFEGTEAALYQIQLDHAARPSVTFGLRESFNDFLKDANSKSEDVPSKLDDLANSGIRLVISDKQDPDGAPRLFACASRSLSVIGHPASS